MSLSGIPPLVAVLLGGLAILWLGRRGRRVDDHPVCRGCGYDLVGSALTTCPECGADLARRRAIRRGNRRPIRALRAAGAACVVPAAVALVVLGAIGLSDADLNPHKPYWLLRYEARHGGTADAVAALDEINARWQADALTPDQQDQLIEDALATHADDTRPWGEGWARIITEGHADGLVRRGHLERLLQRLVEFAPDVPAAVPRDLPKDRFVHVRLNGRTLRAEGLLDPGGPFLIGMQPVVIVAGQPQPIARPGDYLHDPRLTLHLLPREMPYDAGVDAFEFAIQVSLLDQRGHELATGRYSRTWPVDISE